MAMSGTIERGKDKVQGGKTPGDKVQAGKMQAGAIDAERRRRQRMRNWAVLAALVAFCVVVYAITMVKLKGG